MISHNRHAPECGVSESIGFMLILTLVIVGIGMVTLYGYPLLMKQQVSADEQIMEKNMIVLQNDIKSLAYKTVPYKETSLKIGGGTLGVYNASSTPAISTITLYNADTSEVYVQEFHPGDLRYESENAQEDISLQNGAVLKRPRLNTGSVMIAEPRWFYDSTSNTMVINLISINSTTFMSREGIGTVQMALGESSYQYVPLDGDEVVVEYAPDPNADYSTAWNNYFVNSLNMEKVGTSTYRLPFDSSRKATLAIKKYDVFIKSL
ncbi:hypothetical protein [Methanoregula sp.]|uniref:DUF7289 family protein n=1 Tax=Methanoregula sp. TaxID=2052170 RepID=UPI00237026E4|nr:hypothetical protein [Methanoregula sp.]MDD1686263.1 hypothetical protein [Methanoregula sp.]